MPNDCNDMRSGAYYLSNSNYTNMPTSASGFLFAYGQGMSRFAQFYISTNGGFYTRTFNGVFSSWKSFS